MEVLGVPEVDEPRMLKLTQELFGGTDPDLNRTGSMLQDADDAMAAIQAVVADFVTYFNAITENRREHPRDDVASVIANGQVNGAPLGALEAMGYYIIVATAGHDTTSNTTASALWALCENQDQLRKLKENPALISGLLDELIRWATPVKHFMRTATADAELRGQKIAKGDWLMLSYPSGNRDEEVFADPFKFDIERSPNKHLAFGYGADPRREDTAEVEMPLGRICWPGADQWYSTARRNCRKRISSAGRKRFQSATGCTEQTAANLSRRRARRRMGRDRGDEGRAEIAQLRCADAAHHRKLLQVARRAARHVGQCLVGEDKIGGQMALGRDAAAQFHKHREQFVFARAERGRRGGDAHLADRVVTAEERHLAAAAGGRSRRC